MAKTQSKKSKKKDDGKLTFLFVLKNIVIAAAVIAALLFGISWWLGVYTHHGKTVVVPDLTNLTDKEAAQLAKRSGVRATVEDSVYIPKLGKGVVFRQDPRAYRP